LARAFYSEKVSEDNAPGEKAFAGDALIRSFGFRVGAELWERTRGVMNQSCPMIHVSKRHADLED